MPDVLTQLPTAIDELQRLTGAKEFHFADIYGGTGDLRGVDLQARLGVFRFMAKIFQFYQFPVFVQTLDPRSLSEVRSPAPCPNGVGPFNLKKHEDTALLFLLIRVKCYIEETRQKLRLARVFVDEGYKRNGTAICIPGWKSVFADGLICFASSSSVQPLQLADFAAYALNRTQLLLGKRPLNPLDKSLLEILEPIWSNYRNMEKKTIQLEELDDDGRDIHVGDRVQVWRIDARSEETGEHISCFLGWEGTVTSEPPWFWEPRNRRECWVEFDHPCPRHGDTGGVFLLSELKKLEP